LFRSIRPDGSWGDFKIANSNTVLVLIDKHEGLRRPRSPDIRHFPKDVIPTVVAILAPVHPTVHGDAPHSRVCLPTDPNPGFIRRALVDGRSFRVGSYAAVSARHEQQCVGTV